MTQRVTAKPVVPHVVVVEHLPELANTKNTSKRTSGFEMPDLIDMVRSDREYQEDHVLPHPEKMPCGAR